MSRTTKRKRRFAQDFSGKSLTDQSFAPACDVNRIVKHYQDTGLDPYRERLAKAHWGIATTQTFADAMRIKAEFDSAFALLPLSERERYNNDPEAWLAEIGRPDPSEAVSEALETALAEPAPQDSTDVESEE